MHLVKEKSSLPRLLVFPFLILLLVTMVLLQHWPQAVLELAHCPLREMTGLPCPTCGGTQAAIGVAQGQLAPAFHANPLVTAGFLAIAGWSIYALLATVFSGLRRSLVLGSREKRAARYLAALLVAGTWIWEIIRH